MELSQTHSSLAPAGAAGCEASFFTAWYTKIFLGSAWA